jgi:hypothetical protein
MLRCRNREPRREIVDTAAQLASITPEIEPFNRNAECIAVN